ncbi:hypothetical protein [Flavobacterium sp. ASW18X]|uniref:hypothetical protein n=1 Tax=Flavobacterium sp. ASW18X TaxID=2572595 RepID=UPI0010AE7FA0|nr:hypothetical protein [Flavobacterium sp. ASW18X]TKD60997.1 hypothetical protein FBT53_12110 [Flavobacterium sp. ASW18X]
MRTIFIRSIKSIIRLEFSKPWRKFRMMNLVFSMFEKNTSYKVSFLLVRLLWTSKENEQLKLQHIILGNNKDPMTQNTFYNG